MFLQCAKMDKSALDSASKNLALHGFAIIDQVFDAIAVENILSIISSTDSTSPVEKKATHLFAIRQLFKEIPALIAPIFTDRLKTIIHSVMGDGYSVVKSIYFDKPAQSNWFVAYHQDLTIAVAEKHEVAGFGQWTNKQGYFSVQPPLQILEDNFTIRIHLDDTNDDNGALRVIPQSHTWGIYRSGNIDTPNDKSISCHVQKGGIMLMKPLLMHASGRTTNGQRRRVLHIECSNHILPPTLNWSEKLPMDY